MKCFGTTKNNGRPTDLALGIAMLVAAGGCFAGSKLLEWLIKEVESGNPNR